MNRIVEDLIPRGRHNRPMTNPSSSLYGRVMRPKWITVHNTGNRNNTAGARSHSNWLKTLPVGTFVSWHFTIDDTVIYQHLPLNESGWHAGDNLGPGNTQTIGLEICENQLPQNMKGYLEAEEQGAMLCAHLIKTVPYLHDFPDCMKQHFDWSGKNCPSVIRGRANGWRDFLGKVEKHLAYEEEDKVQDGSTIPQIQRLIDIKVNGEDTDEMGYLINGRTYVRAGFVGSLMGVRVTGHGTYINIHSSLK